MLTEDCSGQLTSKRELWRTSTLVGNWFLGLGDDGRPEVAGRISRGIGSGRYLITYSFIRDGVSVEPVLNADVIAHMKWLLFDSAATWRDEFTKASM